MGILLSIAFVFLLLSLLTKQCPTCNGVSAAYGTCETCNGHGFVMVWTKRK